MPIGARQYQMAIALPGQRMSYQDDTKHKGDFEQWTNAESIYMPFGRFVAQLTANPRGQAFLPVEGNTDVVLGIVPIQGHWEAGANGEVGVPPACPISYACRGIFAVETAEPVVAGESVLISASAENSDAKGKLVPATHLGPTVAIPGDYRVIRVLPQNNLAIIEINFTNTL